MLKVHVTTTSNDLSEIDLNDNSTKTTVLDENSVNVFNIEKDIKIALICQYSNSSKITEQLEKWQVWEMRFLPHNENQVFFVIENNENLYIGIADIDD